MSKSINILEKEYVQWVKSLVERYRQSQIKAAVKVNTEQLKFNWLLGRDIVEKAIIAYFAPKLRVNYLRQTII